jgi:beta-glucosidase
LLKDARPRSDLGAPLTRAAFGPDFLFGAATSALQIEGAAGEGGRGPSIWDTFARSRRGLLRRRSPVRHGHTPEIACDHYRRYREDVDLMASLHLDAYRFSVSWPRVLPEGVGAVNPEGVAFYHRLLDALAERAITPFVTLYHWDLPQALETRGGWTNRETVAAFANFAAICAREYGDRVRHWILLNEGITFTGLGHFFGTHAPGRRRLRNFLPAVHHCLLAQGEGGRAIKEVRPDAAIGTAIAATAAEPRSDRERDRAAARRVGALCRTFVDPAVGRGYPVDDLPFLAKIESRVARPGDLDRIRLPLDFLGVNHYFRLVVRHNPLVPFLRLSPARRPEAEIERAANGWEVHPPALYDVLAEYGGYPEIPALYVTENGAAYRDEIGPDGRVEDPDRIAYLRRYLAQVLRARESGVDVRGYFVWSLLDNFEWDCGYDHRFGLVHVDWPTGRRTVKASGRWYREFLAGG